MARVFSAKAGKDYPDDGIKKGEKYYYWTVGFRGRKQRSPTPPRRSQTIGSETLSNAVAAQEAFEDDIDAASNPDDVKEACESAASDPESIIDGFEEKISNLEESFQGGCPAIEETEEQKDSFQSWMDELNSFDIDEHKPDDWPEDVESFDDCGDEDKKTAWLEACKDAARNISFDL